MKVYHKVRKLIYFVFIPSIVAIFIIALIFVIGSNLRERSNWEVLAASSLELESKSTIFQTYADYRTFGLKQEAEVYLSFIGNNLQTLSRAFIQRGVADTGIYFVDMKNNSFVGVNGDRVYSPDSVVLAQIIANVKGMGQSGMHRPAFFSRDNKYRFVREIETTGQNLYLYVELSNPFERSFIMLFVSILIFVVFLVVILLWVNFLIKQAILKITDPVEHLTMTSTAVMAGNIDVRAVHESDDEIGTLADAYNKMLDQLSNLINEKVKLSNLLNNIIESTPNAVFTVDPDGKVIVANRAAKELLQLETNPLTDVNFFSLHGQFARYHDIFMQIVSARKSTLLVNEQFDINGRQYVLDVNIYPLIANGIDGGVFLFRDVSEIHKHQKALLVANKFEAVGRFTSEIVHDFNNLLGAIDGYISTLDVQGDEGSIIQTELQSAILRAKELINNLLSFTRKQTTQFDVIDLYDIISRPVMITRRLFKKSMQIINKVPSGRFYIRGNQGQLEQVISNLIINARDAIDDANRSFGFISIEAEELYVDRFSIKQYIELDPGTYVQLRITDNGTGIDPAILENIFDPLFTTKPEGKGTGLGLSIVYGIVMQHLANIKVYSEIGIGTTFRILFPAVKETDEEQLTEISAEPAGAENAVHSVVSPDAAFSRRIVIVDDEDIVRTVLKYGLEIAHFHNTCSYQSVDEFAAAAETGITCDILFFDWKIRGFSEERIANLLDKCSGMRKVVIMSGFPLHDGQFPILKPVLLLHKPFNFDRLYASLPGMLSVVKP